MATAAHAQDAPAIRMAEPAVPQTVPATTAPAAANSAPSTARPLGLDLQFRDIAVKDLLNTLGQQFGINLSVSADVDGFISSINLTNQTPEEALQIVVATVGNLSLNRMANGTYIVNKVQPGAITPATNPNFNNPTFIPPSGFAPGTAPIAGFAPGGFGQSPIAPSNNGFGANVFGNGGAMGINALPALGQSANNPLLNDLPTLVEANNGRNERRQRTIQIRNVPSNLIAYQLDPVHNKMPVLVGVTDGSNNDYGSKPFAHLALADSGVGTSASVGTFGQDALGTSSYVNPYLQNVASSLITPQMRSNAQFGGGGFGGNRGGGGGFGGGGNNRGGNGGLGGGRNGGGGGGGSFELPGDIEQIVSVDPQNVLLVAGGSDEDIRRLQELIDVLDQPLRQVEIEAQFVELSTQDAQTFGIDFSTSRGNFDASTTGFAAQPQTGSVQIGFVRNNFQARLSALIAANRAKAITAPRVTAINNLTATLSSSETRPLLLNTVQQNIAGGQQQGQTLLGITSTTQLTVTPTINGDDTITVLMQPTVQTQDGTGGFSTQRSRQLITVANVRDGDTIALGGLKTANTQRQNYKVPILGDIPLIGGLFRSKTDSDNETELIIFLRAKIVRRAGDNVGAVPGT